MKVSKFQAAGNDFVLINNLKEKIPHHYLPQLAVKICDRHFSVGADGLILTERAEAGADFKMVFLNANGTYAEMCGNGARALARFAYEEGLAGSAMAFESMAGLVKAQRLDENRYQVRLNEATVHEVNVNVAIDGKEYRGDYIELGGSRCAPFRPPPAGLGVHPRGGAVWTGPEAALCRNLSQGCQRQLF